MSHCDYYNLLIDGRTFINDLSVLKPEYLILFKMKAYLDLKTRYDRGEHVDNHTIKKHKNDVLRILSELILNKVDELPIGVKNDVQSYIASLALEPYNNQILQTYGLNQDDIVDALKKLYL